MARPRLATRRGQADRMTDGRDSHGVAGGGDRPPPPGTRPPGARPVTWTERELSTLAEVAETFVRGDARRRARLTTETLERAADPAQVRQFHRLLGLMESRLVSFFLVRRPTPFTSMSP